MSNLVLVGKGSQGAAILDLDFIRRRYRAENLDWPLPQNMPVAPIFTRASTDYAFSADAAADGHAFTPGVGSITQNPDANVGTYTSGLPKITTRGLITELGRTNYAFSAPTVITSGSGGTGVNNGTTDTYYGSSVCDLSGFVPTADFFQVNCVVPGGVSAGNVMTVSVMLGPRNGSGPHIYTGDPFIFQLNTSDCLRFANGSTGGVSGVTYGLERVGDNDRFFANFTVVAGNGNNLTGIRLRTRTAGEQRYWVMAPQVEFGTLTSWIIANSAAVTRATNLYEVPVGAVQGGVVIFNNPQDYFSANGLPVFGSVLGVTNGAQTDTLWVKQTGPSIGIDLYKASSLLSGDTRGARPGTNALAFRLNAAGLAYSINGGPVYTTATPTPLATTTVYLGNFASVGNYAGVRRFIVPKVVPSNDQLQVLSSQTG